MDSKTKEMLEKQLQLLSERVLNCTTDRDLEEAVGLMGTITGVLVDLLNSGGETDG